VFVCVCLFQWLHVVSLECRSSLFHRKLVTWQLGRLFGSWLDRHRRKRWRRQRTHLILQAVGSLWQKNAFMAWQHYVLAVRTKRKEFVLARVLFAWKLLTKREHSRRIEAADDRQIMQQIERERERAKYDTHADGQVRAHGHGHAHGHSVHAPMATRGDDDVDGRSAFDDERKYRGADSASLDADGVDLGSSLRGIALSPTDLDEYARSTDQLSLSAAPPTADPLPQRSAPAHWSPELSRFGVAFASARDPQPLSPSFASQSPSALPVSPSPSPSLSPSVALGLSGQQQWRLTPFRSSLAGGAPLGLARQLPPPTLSPAALAAMAATARVNAAAARAAATPSPTRPQMKPQPQPQPHVTVPSSPSPSRRRQDELAAERERMLQQQQQQQQQLTSPASASFIRKLFAD